MINKNIEQISYKDIEFLLENKISESDVLDYKREMIKDEKLIKQVCAFANTRGGDIVFGVKESGGGGYPTEICGLDGSEINKERMEQVILSKIVPRLDVKIKIITIPDSKKTILLVRIPDSHLKPHQNDSNKKFYKRFQFESSEMTEQEVCDSYRKRFRSHDHVEQYIEKISSQEMGMIQTDAIKTRIIIIPTNIEYRMIETSDYKKLKWFDSIGISTDTPYAPSASFLESRLEPASYGLLSSDSISNRYRQIQIHRNGCIQHVQYLVASKPNENYFPHGYFAIRLMQSLEFADKILQHYNYFGNVRIIVMITCQSKNILQLEEQGFPSEYFMNKINCKVERECSLQNIANYDEIASSIMDEVFNHYGVLRCGMFDKDGKITNKALFRTNA